ncbi:RagB/SusD family nutrient uptake outer membrane protein [Proteiniphilum sp. UBA1028]|jgi:hypothetical protein|uniref:RagB/SusD family nutrient uptake outer membrane protein n=1 Tax=Proteiniphilum sp. UBA1028 TaxID=1947251 RepID=UPI0025E87FCD|nr:RagB/SusD family nutrient uptake outer membrane protein [Proteiniphilum sp. UBA1028]
MKKIKITTVLAIFLLIGFLGSCSDDMLVEKPPHFITADVLYTNVDGFNAGINGLYSLVQQERSGINYTGGFGKIDLCSQIYLAGTDNVATGTSGGLTTLLGDWTKSTSTDPNLDKIFLWLYKAVSASNQIISRAENPDVDWGVGENNKEKIVAEARAIRAWAYRHLTYLWGDVPLMTEEVSGENIQTDLVREKVSVIRKLMINDLKYASENLPWIPEKAGHISRGAVQTYLAETYLAVGKPDSALYWTNECINKGPYKLITSRYGANSDKPGAAFMDMFHPSKTNISDGNTEALWVLQYEQNVVGGSDNLMRHETTNRYDQVQYCGKKGFLTYTDERGGRGWSRQTLTKKGLLLYYSSSDSLNKRLDQRGSEYAIRKYFTVGALDDFAGIQNPATKQLWKAGDTVWLATPTSKKKVTNPGDKFQSGAYNFNLLSDNTSNDNNWPYSLKFAYCDPGFPTTTESHSDQVFMRLAETVLLRAEAKGRLNNLQGAANDINLLRDRANAKLVTISDLGTDLTSFLDYILDERSRELLLEEQRRYTLLRMGGEKFFFRRVQEFNKIDKNMTLRDTLFAIPQTVIDANLNSVMPQNPGFNQ